MRDFCYSYHYGVDHFLGYQCQVQMGLVIGCVAWLASDMVNLARDDIGMAIE